MRWRLKAEQALMYDEEGVTKLRKLVANVYQKDRAWTIVGDEGELDRNTNNVEVRHNVVVTSDDGTASGDDTCSAGRPTNAACGPTPQSCSRATARSCGGQASTMRMADETATVSGRVRATFVQGKGNSRYGQRERRDDPYRLGADRRARCSWRASRAPSRRGGATPAVRSLGRQASQRAGRGCRADPGRGSDAGARGQAGGAGRQADRA